MGNGRADYFIGEFPGADDLSQYVDGAKFVPVPGLKLVLQGSRYVAVSKRFPHSKQVFDAIQIVLKDIGMSPGRPPSTKPRWFLCPGDEPGGSRNPYQDISVGKVLIFFG